MAEFTGPAFGLLGAGSAVHMAEEIKSPAINVPRAMIVGVFVNGLMGLGMLVALLFTLGNQEAVIIGPVSFPYINILLIA